MRIDYTEGGIVFLPSDVHGNEAAISILTGAVNGYCKHYLEFYSFEETDLVNILSQYAYLSEKYEGQRMIIKSNSEVPGIKGEALYVEPMKLSTGLKSV